MQIILVRHGQPLREHNPDGRIADPGLSELGAEQARLVCGWLHHEGVDHVVTSPKRRAIETVAPLLDKTGLTHEVVRDLDEVDARSSTYIPTELLASEGGEYWQAILRGDYDALGWDRPEVFDARVDAAFADLLARRPGDTVVVACHGGVIRRIVTHVLGLTGYPRIDVGYASLTRVRVDADGRTTLSSLNESAHFESTRERVVGAVGTHPQ